MVSDGNNMGDGKDDARRCFDNFGESRDRSRSSFDNPKSRPEFCQVPDVRLP